MPIWTISPRFFSPPEKPTFTPRFSISMSKPERIGLLARDAEEIARGKLLLAPRPALRVQAPCAGTGRWRRRESRPDTGSPGRCRARRARAARGRGGRSPPSPLRGGARIGVSRPMPRLRQLRTLRPLALTGKGSEHHRTFGHLVARPPGEHICERRLARPVRPHHRVDLPGVEREADAVQDRLAVDGGVEVIYL